MFKVSVAGVGFTPKEVWCPAPSHEHRMDPYPVPKTVLIGTRGTSEAHPRFSPSPYAVLVEDGERRVFVGLSADPGWHQWNYASFKATRQGVEVRVDLEGHTSPREAARHIRLHLIAREAGEDRHAQLARALAELYPKATHDARKKIPAWWLQPSYCGWGDQVGMSLALEGVGYEPRALAYNIQGLYERWIRRLEEADVPFGTITIDAGWSKGGTCEPLPMQWPDLKGFIARQHERGRRVLLWIAAWYREGLPEEWCIHSGKTAMVADPSNPDYRRFLEQRVHELLSPDGFDADGFKIDGLGTVPSERESWAMEHFGRREKLPAKHAKIRAHGRAWGCELLRELQLTIYRAAKAAKPDSLISSSTVHPYFYDTFDMVRLHDTGMVKGDSVVAMKARADLSRAALPMHPVDADDWVPFNYEKWLYYTLNSHVNGVPCIFYAENFVRSFREEPTALPIPMSDLRKVARAWRKHLSS